MEEELLTKGWTCTDPDAGQWAKKKDDFSWYYFEGNNTPENATLIDIREYTIGEIESTIQSYGYTLGSSDNKNRLTNIQELYKDDYIQIIAEYIFEDNFASQKIIQ